MMARLKQAELGKRAGVSASYISYLENGEKAPALSVSLDLADAFGLKGQQRDKLLQAAGFKPSLDLGTADALTSIRGVFQDPDVSPEDRDALGRALRDFVDQWRDLREERKRGVRKAVVVAAGWGFDSLTAHHDSQSVKYLPSKAWAQMA